MKRAKKNMEDKWGRLVKAADQGLFIGGTPNFHINDMGLDKSTPLMKPHKFDNCIDGIETYENSEFNMAVKETQKRKYTYGL